MSESEPSRLRPQLTACPLCRGSTLTYQFRRATTPIVRCERCSLMMRNPQPSDAELAAIYTDSYFLSTVPPGVDSRGGFDREVDALKRATAVGYLDAVESRRHHGGPRPTHARLLEVGSGLGNLLIEAHERGYLVTGVEYAEALVAGANARLGAGVGLQGTLESAPLDPGTFDVCVCADVIEHTRDPMAVVTRAR